MFNNKFGLKADFGYNNFKDGVTQVFDLNIIEQTYKLFANLGRIISKLGLIRLVISSHWIWTWIS
jgi:OOP family OmpA-OmpF porin